MTVETQPATRTIAEPGYDRVEIVDMGDHLILLQPDETGEVQSVVLGPQALAAIREMRQ